MQLVLPKSLASHRLTGNNNSNVRIGDPLERTSRRSVLLRSAFFSYPVPRTGAESARTVTGVGKLAVP
jgi:hypothetical protein